MRSIALRISASETAGAAALAAFVGMRIGLDMVTGFSVKRLRLSTLQKLLTAEVAESNAEIAERAILTFKRRLLKKQSFLCELCGFSLRSQRLKAFERGYSSSG